jgi:hypothetical protein
VSSVTPGEGLYVPGDPGRLELPSSAFPGMSRVPTWVRDRAERLPRALRGVSGLRYLPAVQRPFPDTFIK